MRAFVTAVIVAVAIATIGGFVLSKFQEPVQEAFSTSAVRL